MDWSWVLLYGVIPFAFLMFLRALARKALDRYWGRANLDGVDLRGKVALVTGANSGVGFETAVALADRGATVVVTGRTLKRAKKLVIRIRQRTFLGKLVPFKLELGSLESVRHFCEGVKQQFDGLDLLINNAGVLMPVDKREKTEDGFEIHFGVNHLGHFLKTALLFPYIRKSGRVVIVSSISHRGAQINFDDLMYEKTEIKDTEPSGNVLYMQSKLANTLFQQELRRRAKNAKKGIKVFSCCPGIVTTNITRNLDLSGVTLTLLQPILKILFKTPEQGAQTILYCALTPNLDDENCILYQHCTPWNPGKSAFPDDLCVKYSKDAYTDYSEETSNKLWMESEKLVGHTFKL